MVTLKQKIVPHLWFDKEAIAAAEFYTSVFDNSRIKNITTLHDTPSGPVDIVTFELFGQEFMAISAGPLFKFNESISFMVKCDTQDEIDFYWKKLTGDGGQEIECGWLVEKAREKGLDVQTGEFRTMMAVSLINDGPLTLIVESK
jgi:predicted 3-demethylubiquinone-9 3-methyltransferase (glyoxalase superfamily)